VRCLYKYRLGQLAYLRWFGVAAAGGPTYPTGTAGPSTAGGGA
jgi:hypothetical protein